MTFNTINKSLKWHVESISCKNNTFVKTELYCKYLNSMKSFKNSKKHVKIINVYSLYIFFRMSKLLNNIYRARCLSLGVKTSSIHLFFKRMHVSLKRVWNVLNVTTFQKCRSDIKSYLNSFYIIHLLYMSYFRPVLYSPFSFVNGFVLSWIR